MLPTVFLACNVIYAHRGFQSLTPLPRVKKGNKVFYTKLLFYLCILLPTILYLRLALVGFRTPKFKEQGTVVSRFICLSYPLALIAINLSQFQNKDILFQPWSTQINLIKLNQDNPSAFLNSTVQRVINRSHIYAISAWILLTPDWLCFDWAMGCLSLIKEYHDLRIIGVVVFWGIFVCIIGEKQLLNMNASRIVY